MTENIEQKELSFEELKNKFNKYVPTGDTIFIVPRVVSKISPNGIRLSDAAIKEQAELSRNEGGLVLAISEDIPTSAKNSIVPGDYVMLKSSTSSNFYFVINPKKDGDYSLLAIPAYCVAAKVVK